MSTQQKWIVCLLLLCLSISGIAHGNGSKMTEVELLFGEIPVVFAAGKVEQRVEDAPAAIKIITANEIKRSGYRTLADALRGITGFYVTYDRNYEYLGVRGYNIPSSYSCRTLILVNGLTLNDNMYGTGPVGRESRIDIDSIDRIEIIKGPGSALYGSYALFAVINIITKDAKTSEGIKASVQSGSHQSKEGDITYGKKFNNGLELFLSGSKLDTEGQNLYFHEFDAPKTNNGVAEKCERENVDNLFTKISYGDFSLQSGLSSRDKINPLGFYETVFNDDRNKRTERGHFLELKFTPELNETKTLMGRIYYQHYGYDGDFICYGTGTEPYKKNNAYRIKNDWFGAESQINWQMSEKNQLILGAEYQNNFKMSQRVYDEGLSGEQYYKEYLNDNNHKWDIWTIYLQNTYKMRQNLSSVLGGRLDYYSNFGKTINPRIGIIYNPFEKSAVKLLYGSAFRAPLATELYFYDKVTVMEPSPNIKPEKLKTYEAVFEQGISENIKGILSLYQTKLSDMIMWIESSEFGPDFYECVNKGKVKTQGIELSLKGKWDGIEGKFGYNHQKAKDEETGQQLVNSHGNSGNLGLSIPFEKFYLTGEMEYIGKTLTGREDEKWLNPYLLTNLILFTDNLIPQTEITFKINNLFNESYAHPIDQSQAKTLIKIQQDKRNFLLKVGYKF